MVTVKEAFCPQNHRCPVMNMCPVNAITQDSPFSAPKVDMSKCIKCGKCVKACYAFSCSDCKR